MKMPPENEGVSAAKEFVKYFEKVTERSIESARKPEIRALIQKGYTQLVRADFRAALTTFERVLAIDNSNIIGTFYKYLSELGIADPQLGKKELGKAAQKDIELRMELVRAGILSPARKPKRR